MIDHSLALFMLCMVSIACIVVLLWCAFSIYGQRKTITSFILEVRATDGAKLIAKMDGLGHRFLEESDRQRRAVIEFDQGLRGELAASVSDGMAKAFEKVQEGTKTQAETLILFGKDIRGAVGGIRETVEELSEKVTSALAGLQGTLTLKLNNLEVSSANGRADLLKDLSDRLASVTTTTQGTLDKAVATFAEVKISLAAAQAQTERVLAEQREAVLTRIGNEQKSVTDMLRKTLADFQVQVVGHLDGIRVVTEGSLEKSIATLADVKEAIANGQTASQRSLSEQRETLLERLNVGQRDVSERLARDLGSLNERVRLGFEEFGTTLREEQERLRGQVDSKLIELRTSNEAKLEEMRKTVDEQLRSALEQSIGESFTRVAEQFATVQQAIGQVQGVASQIGDIKRLFSNVKARGSWGEAQIQTLLDDVLPPGSYEANLKLGDGAEMVEFALRMPIKGGEHPVWLAIDAKFPTEDYDRLLIAAEAGEKEAEGEARKALERAIKEQARRISTKYVKPPRTVNYALMYLPTEGLYAEVARTPGLIEFVRRDHRIHVVGPALMPAMLQLIRVGHLTLALEQKAGIIGETFGAVKTEWGKLTLSVEALAKGAGTLTKKIGETQRRTRAVGRALKAVEVIEFERADTLLGIVVNDSVLRVPDDDTDEIADAAD